MKKDIQTRHIEWIEKLCIVGGVVLYSCAPEEPSGGSQTAGETGTGGTVTTSSDGEPTAGGITETDAGTEGGSDSADGATTGVVTSSSGTSSDTGDGSTTGNMPPGESCEPLPAKIDLAEVGKGIGGFPLVSTIDLEDLEGSFAGLGFSVSHAGDVNGDGLDDVIIGAPGGSMNMSKDHNGVAYVVFGKKDTAPVNVEDIAQGIGGFAIYSLGEFGYDGVGFSVSEAGDVNGDGLADLIVGSNFVEVAIPYDTYVVFGKKDTNPVSVEDVVQGIGGFAIVQQDDSYGYIVAGGGDLNGDGLDDVLLSSQLRTEPQFPDIGRGLVVFGKKDTSLVYINDIFLGQGGYALLTEEEKIEVFGGSLDVVGDVNGDGLDDVAITEVLHDPDMMNIPFPKRVYVSFGKEDTLPVIASDLAVGKGGFLIEGELVGDQGMVSLVGGVRQAGDVNADGLADVVFGDSHAPEYTYESTGRSYIVLGKVDTNPIQLSDVAQGVGGFAVNGGNPSDRFGSSVGGGGDFNGDGFDDVIVGSHMWKYDAMDPENFIRGRAYIIYGSEEVQGPSFSELEAGEGGVVLEGAWSNSLAGISVDVAGDVNGDGFDDWIVGAIGTEHDEEFNTIGPEQSYIVFGGCDTNTLIQK